MGTYNFGFLKGIYTRFGEKRSEQKRKMQSEHMCAFGSIAFLRNASHFFARGANLKIHDDLLHKKFEDESQC